MPGPPPEFAEPLDGQIGYMLKRAQLASFQDLIERLAPLDLRPAQYALLVLLDLQPGIAQSAAAARLAIKHANFVVLVNGLQARGLVRRRVAPDDRRGRRLSLTAEGRSLTARARSAAAGLEQRLTERLGGPEARERFLAMLRAVVGDGAMTQLQEDEP